MTTGFDALRVRLSRCAAMTRPVFSRLTPTDALERAGFRFGARGTHSARTIMLRDLTELRASREAAVTVRRGEKARA